MSSRNSCRLSIASSLEFGCFLLFLFVYFLFVLNSGVFTKPEVNRRGSRLSLALVLVIADLVVKSTFVSECICSHI